MPHAQAKFFFLCPIKLEDECILKCQVVGAKRRSYMKTAQTEAAVSADVGVQLPRQERQQNHVRNGCEPGSDAKCATHAGWPVVRFLLAPARARCGAQVLLRTVGNDTGILQFVDTAVMCKVMKSPVSSAM